MKLAPCIANTTRCNSYYLGFPYCCICRICCFCCHNNGKRSAFWDTFLFYLSYESLAVVSINKMLSCHAHFLLYLLKEIESFLFQTTSCICRICRIGRLCVTTTTTTKHFIVPKKLHQFIK